MFACVLSGSAEIGRRSDLGFGAAMRERKAATKHVPVWTWRFRLRSFSCEQRGAFTLESGEAARSYVCVTVEDYPARTVWSMPLGASLG